MSKKQPFDELINDLAEIIVEKENLAAAAETLESVLRKIEKIESLATKFNSDRIKEEYTH